MTAVPTVAALAAQPVARPHVAHPPDPRWAGPRQIVPGRLVVMRVPGLATHRGTPPDLVLRWGAMPTPAVLDVVVHLHGYAARGPAMTLPRDIEPRSGLDLADPDDPATPGRSSPTLLILPRGHYFGGRSGRGYSFPALVRPGALTEMIEDAVRRFGAATGAITQPGRLILTAHSGGGQPLMAILRHVDPDEVHAFDALYTDPGPLVAWARRHRDEPARALRVLYRPGEMTAVHSYRVGAALTGRSPRFRAERTTVPHMDIPRRYGWRLLTDAGADLPGATRPQRRGRRTLTQPTKGRM